MALVELAKFYNGFEASLANGRLDAEGIAAPVRHRDELGRLDSASSRCG